MLMQWRKKSLLEWIINTKLFYFSISLLLCAGLFCAKPSKLVPLRVVADMEIGETKEITLSNGEVVILKLIEINEVRDELRDAVRSASVKFSFIWNKADLFLKSFSEYLLSSLYLHVKKPLSSGDQAVI